MQKYESVEKRFWKNVNKSSDPNGCWEWMGCKNYRGYGKIRPTNKGSVAAHRVSYELNIGKIPDGLYVLHSCDNPSCVNPTHLRVGTAKDNAADMDERNRRPKIHKSKARGTKNPKAKIDESKVVEIRKRYASDDISCEKLGHEYGLTRSHISKIVTRHSWKHVP